jgi:hypothetical protein
MPSTKSKTAAASSAAGLSADIRINDIDDSQGSGVLPKIFRCALDPFRFVKNGDLR